MVNIPYMGAYSGFIISYYIYSVYVVNKHINNIIYKSSTGPTCDSCVIQQPKHNPQLPFPPRPTSKEQVFGTDRKPPHDVPRKLPLKLQGEPS